MLFLMITGSGIFNTIILLGALQGFIVSVILFFGKRNRRTNRLLATLIFLIALASFNLYGNYRSWFNSDLLRFLAELVPMIIIMPLGPLIYFYVQSSLDPSCRITGKQRRHYYAVIVDLVPSLTIIIFLAGLSAGLIKNNPGPWGIFIDTYNVYADIPRWFSLTGYLWLSARYLLAFKTKNNGAVSEHSNAWLRQFIRVFMAFQCIWLVYLVPYVIPRYTDMILETFDWYPIYIPMAVLIYWLGIKGFMIGDRYTTATKKASDRKIALPMTIVDHHIVLLTKAMERDQLYLNPNLNLIMVSRHTGLPQKIISRVLNQHIHKSFNEYINHYRIEEFKKKVQQPETNNLTLAGIALEAGFNSQATFQRTFKELTGMSPSEFRKISHATR